MITDPMGQWKHPGKNTRIPGNNITMKGVNYPVLGVSNNGQEKMMFPGQEYIFPGAAYVDEFPQMKRGGRPRGLVPMPKPSKKGLASKKYSRSLDATNIIFAENPIYKKPKSRRNKIYNPNAKYYQAGGVTQLTPEEELQFNNFYSTLPENLQVDDPTYDIRGYWDALGRPQEFDYSQPTESDGYYHAFSINPNTGEYLKSPAHPTFQHAIDEDRKIGYRPITNVYGRNIATEVPFIADPEETNPFAYTAGPANYMDIELDEDEIDQYVKGGYVVEDISVPSLNTYQGGGNSCGRGYYRNEKGECVQLDWNIVDLASDYDIGPQWTNNRSWENQNGQHIANINAIKVYAKKGKKLSDWILRGGKSKIQQMEDFGKKYSSEFGIGANEPLIAANTTKEGVKKFKKYINDAVDAQNKYYKKQTKIANAEEEKRQEYERARKKVQSGKMSTSTFASQYKEKGWSKYDSNVIEGSGPNKVYSAKEAEAAWKPEVMQDVGKYAHAATMGIVGLATAGALGPAITGSGSGAGTGAGTAIANTVRAGVRGASGLLRNPWVQAGLTGNAAYQIGKDPRATIEGLATTAVEGYDLIRNPSKIPGAFTGEVKNRFGENYGSGVGDVLNVASLSIPGLSLLKKGRDFTKTSKGFELAADYWKPFKDTYKAGVKGFGRFVAPVTEANIPGYAAGVTDMVTGGRGATEFVNRAGLLLSNAPAWAKPTVSNALKGYTLFKAGDGIMNSTEGLSSGNKAQFNEGVKKVTDSTIDAAGVITNVNHLYNLTTPLNVIARGEELKKDFEEGRFDANTAFSALRMVNSIKGMPFHRSQVLPLQDPAFKGATHLKFGRVRDFINKRNGRMKLQKGGIITSASNREIEDLIKRGFIVEELD